MKKIVCKILVALLPMVGFAQNSSLSDASKEKEIQKTIIEILEKANNNFDGMAGEQLLKQETFVMYSATAFPKMYAQNYYITKVLSNERNYYMSYYTATADMQLAKKSIMDLTGNAASEWTMEKEQGNEPQVITTNFFYKGAKVGTLREDLKSKTVALSIGLFGNTSKPVTPAGNSTTTSAKETGNTKIRQIQDGIAKLVTNSKTNFEQMKGDLHVESLYSVMYNTNATPEMFSQAAYINYCKANKKNYFMGYYMQPDDEMDDVFSAIINMPQYGSKWRFEQMKKEDKYDDAHDFVYLAYLYYDEVKVAEIRKNERDKNYFYLLSIGQFDKDDTKKPMYNSLTHPVESYRPSTHLTVANNIITVKDSGPKFDGDYDVTKLSKDSCVSGNCVNGHGRKILASINNNIPRIRIMEGKFTNSVYLGDGDMLIDGESPVVDGTYELGKWKVNYMHNTLKASAIFHPRDYPESVEGEFSGYLDGGIGSAISTYRKFVVCTFYPSYDGRNKDSKWKKDIYAKDIDLSFSEFYGSKEMNDYVAKAKARNERESYSNNQSSTGTTRTSTAPLQKLNIRRTCGACGGTGKIYHNETEYSYSGSSRIATSRRVSQTCGACNGKGVL